MVAWTGTKNLLLITFPCDLSRSAAQHRAGRTAVAFGLMIGGIALPGTVTATLASWLVETSQARKSRPRTYRSRSGGWRTRSTDSPQRARAAALPIGHSWIIFLKKLPITIRIRLSQSRRLTASEGQVETQM